MSGERAEIEELHGDLASLVANALGDNAITISIVSMHKDTPGQWILCDPRHHKLDVARRLRICADILEKQA